MKNLLLVALAGILLVGCASGENGSGAKTEVIASFYPLAFVAEQVGGTHVEVENLTSPGVEPHDLELKPQQVGAVQEADLVIYEKHFQSAVDDAVDQAGRTPESTIEVTALIELLPATEQESGDHDDHRIDPHVWLNPNNMVAITEQVRAKLSAIDPDHAAAYAANARALTAKLTALDTSFATELDNCTISTIVTSHAAFGYLTDRYGLQQIAIAGIDPGSEPSSSQLADIIDLVRSEGITTVFTEELVSPAIAKTVSSETGAVTATLDPIEGLSAKTADENYLTLMAHNLAALTKANDCS